MSVLHHPGSCLLFYFGGVESGRDRQDKFVVAAEPGSSIEHDREVGANLLCAATGKDCNPVFGWIEAMPGGILLPRDGRKRNFSEGMAYESGINPPSPVETFLERKDDQHAADPFLYPTEALALPGP